MRLEEPGNVVQRFDRLRQRQEELPHVPHARVCLQTHSDACRARRFRDAHRIVEQDLLFSGMN